MDKDDTRHGKKSTTGSGEVDVGESSKPFSWLKAGWLGKRVRSVRCQSDELQRYYSLLRGGLLLEKAEVSNTSRECTGGLL